MSVCGCVCLWSVFPWYQLLVSFTICQKGIADLSNSWLVPLPCPAQALWPRIQRVSKGGGKTFCIFSILVFQSPLVGVGSSSLVISLRCQGSSLHGWQEPHWWGKQSGVCCSPGPRGRFAPAPRSFEGRGCRGKREGGFGNYFWRTLCKFLTTLNACVQPLKLLSTIRSFVEMSEAGSLFIVI